jgi:uncharacterized protein with PIN domain
MSGLKEIHLTFEQREKMKKKATCPNCKNDKFVRVLAEKEVMKNHPLKEFRLGRPIVQCSKCGYWTDWFDGWIWHPKEMLR